MPQATCGGQRTTLIFCFHLYIDPEHRNQAPRLAQQASLPTQPSGQPWREIIFGLSLYSQKLA